jgi:hypothetical protein
MKICNMFFMFKIMQKAHRCLCILITGRIINKPRMKIIKIPVIISKHDCVRHSIFETCEPR